MKKRTIVYLCLIGLLAMSLGGLYAPLWFIAPVRPFIQLPGEVILAWPGGSEFLGGLFGRGFTNTFFATCLTFGSIIFLAFILKAKSRNAEDVPTGFYNFFEMIIETAYNYVEGSAGKWTKNFFPFFMTFILWILIANWMELIPLVDSVGKWETMGELALHQAEAETGHHLEGEHAEHVEEEALHANRGDLKVGAFLIRKEAADSDAPLGEEIHHAPTGRNPEAADWTLVPYIRAAATDLNFTIAVALISVIFTQYYGMKAQGYKYWAKFFPFWPFNTYNAKGDDIAKDPLAIMDVGVGILEFISEIFKIVSFAFRLLGNIFAGQVLLFVIGALLPVANILFWHLEFAVGALQAVIFALLTLTFMQGATESHHGDEH